MGRPRSGRRRSRSRSAASTLMLVPVLVVALVLGGYPIASGIWIGFTNERVGGVFGIVKTHLVGLDQL